MTVVLEANAKLSHSSEANPNKFDSFYVYDMYLYMCKRLHLHYSANGQSAPLGFKCLPCVFIAKRSRQAFGCFPFLFSPHARADISGKNNRLKWFYSATDLKR